MAVDLTKLSFYSAVNYLKRDSSLVGSTALTLPASGLSVSHTVTHNLGYVPFFIAGAELQDTSIIWSNNYVHEYTESISASPNFPVTFGYWCSATELTIEITNGGGTGVQTGSRDVWWIIYLDYGT